jgi:CO/xanthine dehydrogenase Mo-binding subunit
MSIIGTRVIRTEDPRLLTVGGVYIDDLRTPELNRAARVTFVRGPLAHACITGIDASQELSEPGVIAQGAAQALLEEMLYDADGNPLTSTLAGYAVSSPPDLPSFELVTSETPTDLNPLGAKGLGEAGSIGSTPAVHNAVVDAVAHPGVRHIDMPATPQRVWAAINRAQKESE